MPSLSTLPAAPSDASASSTGRAAISLGWRLSLAGLGLLLASLLAIAACLDPDPAGYGTHRQLGLAECSLVRVLGQPCPSCGMTTAWAWLMRGQLASAAAANVGGLLSGLLAMVLLPWLFATAWTGRWYWFRPTGWAVFSAATLFIVITLIDWGRRCFVSQWL